MTQQEIIEQIAQMLFEFWKFDMMIYSQWWMYAPFLIPVLFYTVFFIMKWSIITAPVWLPFSIIVRSLRKQDIE